MDTAGGSVKLFGFGCSDTRVRTPYVGFCIIIANKKVEKVTFVIETYWCSNDNTAIVPSDDSRVIVDDENEECVGPKL